MTGRADLHVHSRASDGALSPDAVLEKAVKNNLSAVAIADHDTLAGWKSARQSPLVRDILLLPAVEINTEVDSTEVHILGYCFRDVDGLEHQLVALRDARWERAEEMLSRLQGLGLPVSWSCLLHFAGQAAPGRLHLARALVEAGVAPSIQRAFQEYLLPGKPAYVPRHRLTPQEAITHVRAAGGVAVLAHPGTGVSDALIKRLIEEERLEGIEVYHPAHDGSDIVHYLRMTQTYGLIPTGGTDYHGFVEPESFSIGACTVPMSTVEMLHEGAKCNQRA